MYSNKLKPQFHDKIHKGQAGPCQWPQHHHRHPPCMDTCSSVTQTWSSQTSHSLTFALGVLSNWKTSSLLYLDSSHSSSQVSLKGYLLLSPSPSCPKMSHLFCVPAFLVQHLSKYIVCVSHTKVMSSPKGRPANSKPSHARCPAMVLQPMSDTQMRCDSFSTSKTVCYQHRPTVKHFLITTELRGLHCTFFSWNYRS